MQLVSQLVDLDYMHRLLFNEKATLNANMVNKSIFFSDTEIYLSSLRATTRLEIINPGCSLHINKLTDGKYQKVKHQMTKYCAYI